MVDNNQITNIHLDVKYYDVTTVSTNIQWDYIYLEFKKYAVNKLPEESMATFSYNL